MVILSVLRGFVGESV